MALLCMAFSSGLKAQPAPERRFQVISGETNLPVQGATVQINDGGTVLLTDSLGWFAPPGGLSANATITISFIGYKTYVANINKLPTRILLLPSENTLDNVTVSTGYQQLPKERSTGSFEQLDNKLVNRAVTTNILDRIEGLANGVLVRRDAQGAISLSVRGLSTLTSSMDQPLIVVDNFPFDGDISAINPNDVENITVLRDAAAASVWGARAGNGVIVITTKKARQQAPTSVSFVANTSFQNRPDMSTLNRMQASDYLDVEDFLFSQNFYNNQLNNVTSRPVISPYVEALAANRAGLLSNEALQLRRSRFSEQDYLKDVRQYLYQPALNRQYSLQVSGGGQQQGFVLSVGYDNNQQPETGTAYRRTSVMSQYKAQLTKTTSLNITGQFSAMQNRRNGLGGIGLSPAGRAAYYPYAALTDNNGMPAVLERDYRQQYLDTTGGGLLLNWNYVPLEDRERQQNEVDVTNSWYRLNLQQQLAKGIQLEGLYQFQWENQLTAIFYEKDAYFSRNLVNLYSQRTGNTLVRHLPEGGIMNRTTGNRNVHSGRLQLTVQKTWDQFTLNGLAGGEIRDAVFNSNSQRLYGYNPDNLSSVAVNHTTLFPQWGNLRGNAPIPAEQGVRATTNRFVSGFANAAVMYRQVLTWSGSIRKDVSNIFGVDANQRGVPLWSTGLAWNLLSSLPALKDNFRTFKLRTTYGSSGNVNPALSALTTLAFSSASSQITNVPFARVLNTANPLLRWEKVYMFNAGLDWQNAAGWFSGSLEGYIKNSEDLLAAVSIDPTLGQNIITKNSGRLTGGGVDLKLGVVAQLGPIQWRTDVIASYVTNKVAEYPLIAFNPGSFPSFGNLIAPRVGYRPYALFSYKWAGLDPQNGNPMGFVDKEPSANYGQLLNTANIEDLVYHGTTVPVYFGNFRQAFSWKDLSFSFNISGQFGHWFRANTIEYNALFNNWLTHSDYEKRWQQPGDELRTNVPSMVYPANTSRDRFYAYSEVTAYRADHIRLQDIRIEYAVVLAPKSKKPVRCSFYGYGTNFKPLWVKNTAGLDPINHHNIQFPPVWSGGVKVSL